MLYIAQQPSAWDNEHFFMVQDFQECPSLPSTSISKGWQSKKSPAKQVRACPQKMQNAFVREVQRLATKLVYLQAVRVAYPHSGPARRNSKLIKLTIPKTLWQGRVTCMVQWFLLWSPGNICLFRSPFAIATMVYRKGVGGRKNSLVLHWQSRTATRGVALNT